MPPIATAELTEQQTQVVAEFVAARGAGDRPLDCAAAQPGADEAHARTQRLPAFREHRARISARIRDPDDGAAVGAELRVERPLPDCDGRGVVSRHRARGSPKAGGRPAWSREEEILYDLCLELQRNHSVSDETYERAVERFGEQGVVEIVSLAGYYTMISMILNTSRAPLPAGAAPALAAVPVLNTPFRPVSDVFQRSLRIPKADLRDFGSTGASFFAGNHTGRYLP